MAEQKEGTYEYPETAQRLEAMGHSIRSTRPGDAHSTGLERKTGMYIGAADHRINGKVSGF